MVGFSGLAYAQFRKPKITPLEGQSKQQQAKDEYECSAFASQETNISPLSIEMQMKTLQSQQSMYSRPISRPGGSIEKFGAPLPPSRHGQLKQVEDKIKALQKEHKEYLKVFSDFMEARGYEVK
jgi:hypothetical protein